MVGVASLGQDAGVALLFVMCAGEGDENSGARNAPSPCVDGRLGMMLVGIPASRYS
jgi:hypothetical protein